MNGYNSSTLHHGVSKLYVPTMNNDMVHGQLSLDSDERGETKLRTTYLLVCGYYKETSF